MANKEVKHVQAEDSESGQDKKFYQRTGYVIAIVMLIMGLLSDYEIFFGGLNHYYLMSAILFWGVVFSAINNERKKSPEEQGQHGYIAMLLLAIGIWLLCELSLDIACIWETFRVMGRDAAYIYGDSMFKSRNAASLAAFVIWFINLQLCRHADGVITRVKNLRK